MRAPGLRLVALVLAALGQIGCGDQPQPTAPAPSGLGPAGVCALLPDMDAIVGRASVAPPTGFTTGALDRCLWVYASDPSRAVGLTVGPRTSHAETIAAFGAGEQVRGVGDEARWWSGPRTLSVASGERSFQIDLQLDEAEASVELAVAIAREVVEHLP